MSLPAGHLGLEAVIWVKTSLYVRAGYVPHLAAEGAVLWSALVALGWAQWFALLPWLARCARRGAGRLLARHSAR